MSLRCIDFIENLPLRSHTALFYADKMEKHWRVLKLIHSALARDHEVLYLTQQDEVDYSKELMRVYGIKVPQYERRKQLQVLSSREFYLERCGADKEKIIGEFRRFSGRAHANGFKGVFAVGDISCFLDEGLEYELMDYELFQGKELSMDIAGLCLYDSLRVSTLSEEFKAVLIRSHSSLVFSSNLVELVPRDVDGEMLALNLLRSGATSLPAGRVDVVHGRLVAMDRECSYVVMKLGEEGGVTRRFSVESLSNGLISELTMHLGEEIVVEVADGRLRGYKVK